MRPAPDRKGFLLAEVSLTPLARDVDRIVNADPTVQRGYLLSSSGQVINQPPELRSGADFAARFPRVWRAVERGGSEVLDTDNALLRFFSGGAARDSGSGSGDGLFLFKGGLAQQRLAVVIQVPNDSLKHTSVLNQPAGRAVIALFYLLGAGVSVGLAVAQQRLADLRLEQQRLLERMEMVNDSAGVGVRRQSG